MSELLWPLLITIVTLFGVGGLQQKQQGNPEAQWMLWIIGAIIVFFLLLFLM